MDSLTQLVMSPFSQQPLPSSAQNQISSGSWIRRFIAGLIYLHSLFFVLMYNSVIISMLSRQDLVDKIDHVDDLVSNNLNI